MFTLEARQLNCSSENHELPRVMTKGRLSGLAGPSAYAPSKTASLSMFKRTVYSLLFPVSTGVLICHSVPSKLLY